MVKIPKSCENNIKSLFSQTYPPIKFQPNWRTNWPHFVQNEILDLSVNRMIHSIKCSDNILLKYCFNCDQLYV